MGPSRFRGKYLRGAVNREDAGSADVDFDGWYVIGSWLLTGESFIVSQAAGAAAAALCARMLLGRPAPSS